MVYLKILLKKNICSSHSCYPLYVIKIIQLHKDHNTKKIIERFFYFIESLPINDIIISRDFKLLKKALYFFLQI